MKISPEALALLQRTALPSAFKDVVREVVPDMGMTPAAEMEETPAFPIIDTTPIEMTDLQVSVPPIAMLVASVPVSWPEMSLSNRGARPFYLTDLRLDLRGVAHMTPGLFALSLSLLAPFVTNNLFCCQEDEQAPAARFSSHRIVTGFTIPANKSTIESKEEVFEIKPAQLVDKVQLRIAGQNRATIRIIKVDSNTGTIRFRVKGTSATPANKKDGDTTVEAVIGGVVVEKANVVVVIPQAIATPHPTFNGVVTPVNRALDTTTSPALKASELPAGHVGLVTAYITRLTIAVNDQFGDRLDSIYAGTSVTERNGEVINQTMSDQGTYQDPVGPLVWPNTPPFTIPAQVPDPAKPGQTMPNPAIEAFIKGPVRPLPTPVPGSQTIPVEVGGHSLNPAIVNRSIQFTPPNTLEITWP